MAELGKAKLLDSLCEKAETSKRWRGLQTGVVGQQGAVDVPGLPEEIVVKENSEDFMEDVRSRQRTLLEAIKAWSTSCRRFNAAAHKDFLPLTCSTLDTQPIVLGPNLNNVIAQIQKHEEQASQTAEYRSRSATLTSKPVDETRQAIETHLKAARREVALLAFQAALS